MKQGVFIIVAIFIVSSSYAQVFWTETFDGTPCAAGSGCDPTLVGWTVTNTGANGSAANKWYVSARECGNAAGICGSTCTSDQSLHIGNVPTSSAAFLFCPAGDCGASYDASSSVEVTNKRAESPTIDCSGQSNITVDFNYIENGEGTNDNAEFWYFDGATWSMLVDLAKTATCLSGQGRWTSFSTTLPASADNNPSVKIGFRWVNDGNGLGSDPSFAVDDITLTNNTVLPVTWLEIQGKHIENRVKISFSTLSEINNEYFEIFKSTDGINFSSIGKVPGNGNTANPHYYEFYDYELINNNPTYYYKIKQVDFNGRFNFSETIAVSTHLNKTYMRINNQVFYIEVTSPENLYVKCFNINGQLLYAGKWKENILLQNFEGVLFVQLISQSIIMNKKIVINN